MPGKRDFFRVGDRVMVHGCPITMNSNRHLRGRVICTNRRHKYDMCIVVLYDTARDSEMIETFKADGKRFMVGDKCHITLGWDTDEDQ